MANDKLSIKEQMFCNEYIKNGNNGTKAVISAGYAEGSASVQQTRLLKKARIQRELERQQNFQLKANSITRNEIIQAQYELYLLARANEEYKTASNILESLTKMLGYAPKLEDKNIKIKHTFESLLEKEKDNVKDITPKMQVISYN